jgi:hypothetical protein
MWSQLSGSHLFSSVDKYDSQTIAIVMVRERGLGLGKKYELYQSALPIPNTEKVNVKRRNKIMTWLIRIEEG